MTAASEALAAGQRQAARRGFVTATASFVAVFAAGAGAIPLYDTYRRVDGVTNAEFSLVAVGYFACAIVALLVFGRLSNHLGRKPVSIAAVLTAAAGCGVLLAVHSFWPLLVGRGLQGLAAGLASSAIAAYAVDTAPAEPKWLVAAVTSASATVGLSVGVFASGALVQFAPAPRELTFCVFGLVLLGCAAALATRTESVTRTPGARRSLVPRIVLPAAARPYLPAAACIFVSTWAFGGYFQAFGPSIAADYLGSPAPLVAAAVFASYMAPGVLGGPVAGRLSAAAAQRLGMAAVTAAGAGLVTATATGSAVLFVAAGILGGLGMGTGMSGSMNALLPHARAHERAGLLALIYAISYTGSALPALVSGQLSHTFSLFTITIGYAALAAAACAITLVCAGLPGRRPHQ